MKLDLLDRKIIAELDKDARQSASQIAKKLKSAKETVNFRINRLLQKEIIKGFYPMIDTSLVNMFFVKLFIKFKEIKPERRKEILDYLSKHPEMSQVLLLEGKFDVQLYLLMKENHDIMNFMENLNTFCGEEIRDKELMITDSLYRFNLKFIHDTKSNNVTEVGSQPKKYKMDEAGLKVLKEITKNARMPVLEIAKNTGMSSQLVQYHLRKLIKDKVIVSTHVSINYDKLKKLHYHLTWQVNDHAVLPKMIEYFNNSKKSIFATKMVGFYDGGSEVIVESSEELRKIIDGLNEQFSEKINVMDVMLIYSEYELRLYPI